MDTPLLYFRWYPRECMFGQFLLMTDAERGYLLRALNCAWVYNGLPADPAMRAMLMDDRPRYAEKLWPKVSTYFELSKDNPTLLINSRQEKERREALEKSAKRYILSAHSQYETPGYVYLVSRTPEYAVKIGSSIAPQKRLRKLQSMNRGGLELIYAFPVDNMRDSEAALHREFHHKRLDGEWFALSKDDIEHIRAAFEGKNGAGSA